jgi:aspartokinase/homoserine dehydrogenase 1
MSRPGKPILVQKFGGSTLADGAGFNACADVVQAHVDGHRIVVVLSAVKGVTDGLIAAIETAVAGGDPAPRLAQAMENQRVILESIGEGKSPLAGDFLEEQQRQLAERLEGVRLLGQCPDETRAKILASGEGFSSRLMADLLAQRGVAVQWSEADVLPLANRDWLDSLVDIEAAGEALADRFEARDDVIVLPGFYGINEQGGIQLLGRNGTDYSAAAMAAALSAEKCQIWKDIDGFYSADPSIVSSAICLEEVSYDEAIELTYFGANVISAKALTPLATSGIPCEVRNVFNADFPGTLVHGAARWTGVVRGISHLPDVATITLQGGGLRGRVGIARRVMDALARKAISILLIVQSSSEYSISLCVNDRDVGQAADALEEEFHFERLHGLIADIAVQRDRAAVSLVGDGMKHYRGIAARFLTAISAAGINVEVIAQGSTECAIAVVVEGDDAVAATRACHTAFFSKTTHVDVLVLGCGNVGGELLEQFRRQAGSLLQGNIELRVRAIANSRKLLVADDVVDLEDWREQLDSQGKAWKLRDLIAVRERLGLLNPTVIDCTTNEDLAASYLRFLENGFHVVAANKKANTGEIAYYRALRETAARNFKKFLYETNVGAGLPVIDTLQALIRSGDRLVTFEGLLSGSLSMILGLLDDGEALSTAVGKAMDLGYTEPDPRDDLSGMDVARKLLIIAREVGLELELEDIEVQPVVPLEAVPDGSRDELLKALQGFDSEFATRAEKARPEDKVLRYVGRIEDGKCSVSIEDTPISSPLGAVRNGENALVLHTRYYTPIPLVLRGYGAGAEVTAAGVFADLLRTAWRPLD